MSTGRCGVVVPVHGPIAPVLPLLEDLLGEHARERPARLLLVDDASTPPVEAADLPVGVELLRRERNGGFAAAVNTGLEALAAGEEPITQALVLNSDLRLPPGFLGDLLHRAVGHDLAAERGHGLMPVDWVSGAVLLLPLSAVRALGGFDEGYFMYVEEVDLQLRLRERGIPSLLDADLEVVHLGGGSAGSEARRRRWLVGARMRFDRRHGHVHALRAALTLASAVNLVWNAGRRAAGREVRPLKVAREELGLIHRAGRELAP